GRRIPRAWNQAWNGPWYSPTSRRNPTQTWQPCQAVLRLLGLDCSRAGYLPHTLCVLDRLAPLAPRCLDSGLCFQRFRHALLVGSDSRQGLSEEDQAELGTGGDVGIGRTDTIMLLHIPRSGSAQLVSIPRDSYVNVPGFGSDKINAAFTYGGPQLLAQTVEEATGVGIDHYAEIGMGGLANVVDSVGGVEICVE